MLKLYLITLTCFLAIICFLITFEIYKMFNHYLIINNKLLYNQEGFENNSSLAKIYMKQKKWLLCIFILEKSILKQNEYLSKHYNALGFCYYSVKKYELAKHYYKRAIKKESNNIIFLFNLAKIYTLTREYQNAQTVYEQVLKIDQNSKQAQKQLLILTKYI